MTDIKKLLKRIDMWKWFDKYFDPYPLVRPFLFMMDPEDAHDFVHKMLGFGTAPNFTGPDDDILHAKAFGLEFSNPILLAAGLDRQATRMDEFMGFGFGAIEIGGVVPRPQPGNPKPRMFRIPHAKSLINRFGFNSVGVDVFAERMAAWRASEDRTHRPVGVNLGKNKDSAIDDWNDYLICLEKIAPHADFVTINISSPNTPGLRSLQQREKIKEVVDRVLELRDRIAPKLPVLVKIAPDLTDEQQADIAAVIKDAKVQGLIVSNTTLARPSTIPDEIAKEAGGLSGPPLFGPSTRVLSNMYKLTEGKVTLIGCGGVSTGEDAYRKIRAGASLVQIYTSLIFEGPLVVQKIKRDLAMLLRRDGFASVADAVGVDCK